MIYILLILFLCVGCNLKGLKITEDILEGEARVVEQIIIDESGIPIGSSKLVNDR